jgi:hypothetical protein
MSICKALNTYIPQIKVYMTFIDYLIEYQVYMMLSLFFMRYGMGVNTPAKQQDS